MNLDLEALWDFQRPDLSEKRFQKALQMAAGDEALILQTQIARTHGLRKNFVKAQEILKSLEEIVASAGSEARVRYYLEWGRSHASAAHPAETQSEGAKRRARESFARALEIAKDAQLEGLAIDAIHMLAFVDTAPLEQLQWAREAMALVEASLQPEAKKWEASIRHNIGYALHQLGHFEEALVQFRQALALRQRGTNAAALHTARWMVAWTLRALGHMNEALDIQLQLAQESEAAQTPDLYVFEELEILYRARGEQDKADHYAALRHP